MSKEEKLKALKKRTISKVIEVRKEADAAKLKYYEALEGPVNRSWSVLLLKWQHLESDYARISTHAVFAGLLTREEAANSTVERLEAKLNVGKPSKGV